jgi:tRNA threonylcarbamoyladenosine modification (KEOPS) complex  Pcc1 subunit
MESSEKKQETNEQSYYSLVVIDGRIKLEIKAEKIAVLHL